MIFKYIEAGENSLEEISLEEIIELIRKYGQDTGGFALATEKEVPKYIVLNWSSRPGPSFESKAVDSLITDGEIQLLSQKHIYNYPTTNAYMYKYKISNANFAVVIEWEGNDYNGGWQEWTSVVIYGNCPFIEKIKELQHELEI
jgi:hypothetical protein